MRKFKNLMSKIVIVFAMTFMFGILGHSNVQAANATTWNPNDIGRSHLTNGNLTTTYDDTSNLSTNANGTGTRATAGKISGKWYWEVTVNDTTSAVSRLAVGVSTQSFNIQGCVNADGVNCWCYAPDWTINSLRNNKSYSCLLDMDNKTLEIREGDVTQFKFTNLPNSMVYPTDGESHYGCSPIAETHTINFGATPFKYQIPTGFSAFDNTTVDNTTVATGVTLNKTTDSITVGQTDTLTATITPDNATNKTVTWISSDPTIATVDSTGKVAAVKEGTATITATTQDGSNLSASCTVTVSKSTVVATGITLNKSTDALTVGNTDQLSATITPSNATTTGATWTSSDLTIATVDSTGKVTAIKAGTATITATTTDGSNLSSTCTVTVTSQNTTPTDNSGNAVLTITMTNGNVKAYTVPMTKVNDFINWYGNRSSGSTGNPYYTFDRTDSSQTTFSKKTEYVVFDKISSFEVDEYSK